MATAKRKQQSGTEGPYRVLRGLSLRRSRVKGSPDYEQFDRFEIGTIIETLPDWVNVPGEIEAGVLEVVDG